MKHNVYIYLPMRIKVKDIEARNHVAAIDEAKHLFEREISSIESPLYIRLLHKNFELVADYEDEYLEYCVTEANGENYGKTSWYVDLVDGYRLTSEPS